MTAFRSARHRWVAGLAISLSWSSSALGGMASLAASSVRPPAADATLAWSVAVQNLFFNTAVLPDPADPYAERNYLLAGANQFRTLWARDFSMSVRGALAVGMNKTAHDGLEALFSFQREDGLLPRTIDNQGINARVILGLAGLPPAYRAPVRGWFDTENGVIAVDSNVIVPWAASHYVLTTGDRAFAARWLPAAESAVQMLERHGYFVDGLVGNQPPYSDWEDSIQRRGRVALTNVYYILALQGLSKWADFLDMKEKALEYALRAEETKRLFHDFFWVPEKGILLNYEGDDRLTLDANLMAVVYGVLSPEESLRVMEVLRRSPVWQPMPGRPTWPYYPNSIKSFNVHLAGLLGYHDAMTWFWITALAARAERAVGNCAGADEIMAKLNAKIAADHAIHEVYDLKRGGRLVPVRRLLYKAEEPFTWSSAMYLESAAETCPRHASP